MIEEPPHPTAANATAAKKSRRRKPAQKPSTAAPDRAPTTHEGERGREPRRHDPAARFRCPGAQYGASRRGKRQSGRRLYPADRSRRVASRCRRRRQRSRAHARSGSRTLAVRSSQDNRSTISAFVEFPQPYGRTRCGACRASRRRRWCPTILPTSASPIPNGSSTRSLTFCVKPMESRSIGRTVWSARRTGSTSRRATRPPSMSGRSPARSHLPISSPPIPN